MIYIVNDDQPGFIGRLGTTLGEAGVNIGTFNLGRRAAGGEAVALVSVDLVPRAGRYGMRGVNFFHRLMGMKGRIVVE
jgi:hypothetical protein